MDSTFFVPVLSNVPNVNKLLFYSSPISGIFYTLALIGPAVGYILGGYFLSIYTDFDTVDTST